MKALKQIFARISETQLEQQYYQPPGLGSILWFTLAGLCVMALLSGAELILSILLLLLILTACYVSHIDIIGVRIVSQIIEVNGEKHE